MTERGMCINLIAYSVRSVGVWHVCVGLDALAVCLAVLLLGLLALLANVYSIRVACLLTVIVYRVFNNELVPYTVAQ